MAEIQLAELQTLDETIANRLRQEQACDVYYPPEGQTLAWSTELNALRGDNAPLLKQQLLEQFGAARFFQTRDGSVFIIPENSEEPCAEFRPGGAG